MGMQIRQDGKYKLLLKEDLSQSTVPILESDSFHFDLSNDGVLYHTLDNANADIYRTVVSK